MNDDPSPRRQNWGFLEWAVVVMCILLLISLFMPTIHVVSDRATQASTANNCRQIIMAMKIWASDHNGQFPDTAMPQARSANEAFRKLVTDEIIFDERIFGAIESQYLPDGETGSAPNFPETLTPGENHWMMMAGLNEKSAGITPFVFENTLAPQWPLTWRGDRFNEPVRGRAWKGGKIVIGHFDNSVSVENLVREKEVLTLPAQFRQTVEKHMNDPLRVLDIEEKK